VRRDANQAMLLMPQLAMEKFSAGSPDVGEAVCVGQVGWQWQHTKFCWQTWGAKLQVSQASAAEAAECSVQL
jgi:hypothetical protein